MQKALIASLALLFCGVLVLQAIAADDVIYGCYGNAQSRATKSQSQGTSYLRIVSDPSQCKKGETSVTLCTKCGGTDSAYKYKVYDANGQHLGLSNEKYPAGGLIYVPSFDKTIPVDSYGEILRTSYLYYESEDCTGQPYVDMMTYLGTSAIPPFQEGEIRIQRFIDLDNTANYYLGQQPRYITTKSQQGFTGFSDWCYSLPSLYPKLLCEATEISESQIPFTLPVALPLHYEPNN